MREELSIAGLTVKPGKRVMENVKIGTLWNSCPANLPLILVNGQKPGPTLCLESTLHGTEYTGIRIAQRVAREVDPNELSGAIVSIIISNPEAYAYGLHHMGTSNPWTSFPGSPAGVGGGGGWANRLCYYLYNEVFTKSNYILDFHGGAEFAYEKFLLESHNDETYEKVGKATSEMAESFGQGLPVLRALKGVGPITGTLHYHAATKGIPYITVEIGGGIQVQKADVEMGVKGVYNIMKHLGMLEGEPEPPKSPVLSFEKAVNFNADEGGIWIPEKSVFKLPYEVSKGEMLGRIVDLFGNEVEVIEAPLDGIQILSAISCKMSSGEWLALVAPYSD